MISDVQRRHLSGFAWMVMGSLLVFGSVLMMNRFGDIERANPPEQASELKIIKTPKPKPKRPEKKPEPPKRQQARTPPNPLQGLNSQLAGLDLGLLGFDGGLGDVGDSLLGDMRDVAMTEDLVDVAPKPTHQAAVSYPASAKSKGITGYVVLNLLITPSGQVEKVNVLESYPAGVFDEVAVAGVRQWRFEPAVYEGKPVRVWAKQKIRFDLS